MLRYRIDAIASMRVKSSLACLACRIVDRAELDVARGARIRRCELRESGKYRQAEWKDHGKERTGETLGQHVASERIELQPLTENQLVGLGEDRSYKCDRAHSTGESPKTLQIGILEGCSVRVGN